MGQEAELRNYQRSSRAGVSANREVQAGSPAAAGSWADSDERRVISTRSIRGPSMAMIWN
jgi:hypothetical protein